MSDKKYHVYICSTYTDLKEQRRMVPEVLLMADCVPIGMQAFFVINDEQFEIIKKIIDICDYFILIIGNRYGPVSRDTGLSYMEMEYNHAKENSIPVLVFAIDDSMDVPEFDMESDPEKRKKLVTFRQKTISNDKVYFWTSSEDLMGKIAVAIMKAKVETIRPGWQKALDYDEATLRRVIMESQTKIELLQKQLDEANEKLSIYVKPDDIEFDEFEYVIKYHYFIQTGGFTERYNGEKKIKLTEVFRVLSGELVKVSLNEQTIESIIKKKIIDSGNSYIIDDPQLVKRLLNQLQALNLLKSHWNEENLCEYWTLTPKGRDKIRESENNQSSTS